MRHSNRAGDSVYPIRPGAVIRLLEPRTVLNPKIKARAEHTVFIWIMKVSEPRKGRQPKDRPVKVCYFYQPVPESLKPKHMLHNPRWVQFETIAKYMKQGYELITDRCPYYYTDQSIGNFYKAIGAI